MANSIYPTYKQSILAALAAGTLKVALVSTTSGPAGSNYVYAAADAFFSAVPAGSIVAAGEALAGMATALSGATATLTAGPVTFAAVAVPANAGQKGEALVFYIDTGTPATSQLVAYGDAENGLPVTPNGNDITLTFTSSTLTLG